MEADFVMEPPVYFAEDHTHIWDIKFHPSSNLIASALISGKIEMYSKTYLDYHIIKMKLYLLDSSLIFIKTQLEHYTIIQMEVF